MKFKLWTALSIGVGGVGAAWGACHVLATASPDAPVADHASTDPVFVVKDGVIEVPDAAARQIGLETMEVRPTDEPVTIRLTGRTSLDLDHVTHVRPPFAGRVVDVGPRLGATVTGPDTQGQGATTLCVVESIDLANAKAAWSKAKAQLALDQDSLRRTKELVATKVLAEKFLLDASTTVAKDEADLRAARQNLLVFGVGDDEIARVDEEEGRARMVYAIPCPCSGTIAEKNVTRGEVVDSTVNLFTIADTSTLWVWGDVHERDWKRVALGQKLHVVLAACPDEPVDCTIDFVSPLLDAASRTIKVRGVVDNRRGRLLADMDATLLVAVDDGRGSLVAPAESVVHEGSSQYVLVQAGRGGSGRTRYRRQPVKAEPLGGDRSRIVDGLEPGAVIVRNNVLGLFQEMHD